MESKHTYDSSLEESASFLGDFCKRWARLGGQTKEKYGTVRFYASFGHLSLHTLFYPGYYYYQFPKWLVKFDLYVFSTLCQKSGLNSPFVRWQSFIYGLAYKKAIQKWPKAENALLSGASYPELIKGGTRREGNSLYITNSKGKVIGKWVS